MRPTILIVDDDSQIVEIFCNWLRSEGYAVRTAADGEAALREVGGTDAIILDARMPTLDGLGFLRRLREGDQQMPVAIVTGDYLIDRDTLSELQRLNAQVVFKPLWLDDLVTLTTEMVNGRRSA